MSNSGNMSFDDLSNIAIGSARGRKASPLHMEYCRELNGADLELIQNPPEKGITTRPLVKLRHTHHFLARMLAEGRKNGEVALMTGYSPSRISILQNDPAFKELISYYKENVEAKYLDVHERLATLGLSSLDELQERLESEPDSFKHRELLELAEFALDRSATKEQRKGQGGTPPPAITISFVGSPPERLPEGRYGHTVVPEGDQALPSSPFLLDLSPEDLKSLSDE